MTKRVSKDLWFIVSLKPKNPSNIELQMEMCDASLRSSCLWAVFCSFQQSFLYSVCPMKVEVHFKFSPPVTTVRLYLYLASGITWKNHWHCCYTVYGLVYLLINSPGEGHQCYRPHMGFKWWGRQVCWNCQQTPSAISLVINIHFFSFLKWMNPSGFLFMWKQNLYEWKGMIGKTSALPRPQDKL